MAKAELKTVREVIKEVGGMTAAAKIVGVTPQAAWNWADRNKFPADTYLVFAAELERKKKSAPASLWGIQEPEAAR